MAGFSDYGEYDALGLAELVAKRSVKPEELLEEAIARASAVNPKINALSQQHYDLARETLRRGMAEAKPEAPFRGVPFLLKDLGILLAGTPTMNGSRLFETMVADHDTTLATRFKAAGFVIFGKTNTPELGITATTEPKLSGATRNPWHTEYSPGGSSGGAAAAVASGILPLAHASDGGGSIRGPASACGVFGMKPTRGRVPLGPDRGEGWGGCSTQGCVSRTVRDSAALLDAIGFPEAGDPYWAPPKERAYLDETQLAPPRLRIAFTAKSPLGLAVDPECIKAVANAARLCESLGHSVEEKAPDLDHEALARAILAFIGPNVAIACEDRAKVLGRALTRADVEALTWRSIEAGRALSAADYVRAQTAIHAAGRRMARFHETYDVLIEPTYGSPPIKLGHLDMDSDDAGAYVARILALTPFTTRYNMTGQPSMSVPLHWTSAGLPVGVMFSGPFGAEGTLFRLAAQLERAAPWKDRRPAVHAG